MMSPGDTATPAQLDRNVNVPIACDCAYVGNNSLPDHGKPHPSDFFDIETGTIDHSCNHTAIERRHRHVLTPKGGVYRPVRIDDHNVTRLGDVNGLEGDRQVSGERLDRY
jgi:hypothetical protein